MKNITNLKDVFTKLFLKLGLYKQVKAFELVQINNCVIVPFSELLDHPRGLSEHKGGPIWNVWDITNNLRHKRVDYVDVLPENPMDDEIENEVRTLFWCGAVAEHYNHQTGRLDAHFGHQIADFTSRIPAYLEYQRKTGIDAYYCFAVRENSEIKSLADTPRFFQQIMDWFDLAPNKIIFVHKPICAKSLLVTPQLEPLNPDSPKLDSHYLLFLNNHVEKKLGAVRKNEGIFYISRSGVKGGELAGESFLDEFFSKNGIVVVHPEKLTLLEQITLYREAKQLIFLEGSALHCLQFLGPTNIDIYIINRRINSKLLRSGLESRFSSVEYLNIADLVYGLSPAGKVAKYDGISLLNINALFSFFTRLNIDISLWDNQVFKEIEKRQLLNWLHQKRLSKGKAHIKSMQLIEQKLNELGIDVSNA